MHRGHVNAINIWPFLTIDFDADEVVIQSLSDFQIFKRLLLHDVAPMARRVADTQKNELALLSRCFERSRTPRAPINGVVRVLQ
jgi:hypothetical protein